MNQNIKDSAIINIFNSNTQIKPVKNRKIKQFENIISQKLVSLSELKALTWKGIPFGKNFYQF
jgi:hypothetical protein